MQNRPIILTQMLLKIIFVRVLIFTDISLEVFIVMDFSQPKETEKPHTWIIRLLILQSI